MFRTLLEWLNTTIIVTDSATGEYLYSYSIFLLYCVLKYLALYLCHTGYQAYQAYQRKQRRQLRERRRAQRRAHQTPQPPAPLGDIMISRYDSITLDSFTAKVLSEDQLHGVSVYQEPKYGVFFVDYEPIYDAWDLDYTFTRYVLTEAEATEFLKLLHGDTADQGEALQLVLEASRGARWEINKVFYYTYE